MELSRIKILINKYLDGITSLEEEQEIARYFVENHNVPEEYQSVKVMFEAFGKLKDITPVAKPKVNDRFTLNANIKWLTGVAASILLVIGVSIAILNNSNQEMLPATDPAPEFVCHIDGVRVEDEQIAYAEVDRILANVSNDVRVAMVEIDNITRYTQIK